MTRRKFEIEIDPHCRLTDYGLEKGDRKRQRAVLLQVVRDKFDGDLGWEQLLTEARKTDSPLHDIGLFNWNVGQAAEAHWKNRAQYLCRHIKGRWVSAVGGQVVSTAAVPVRVSVEKKGDVIVRQVSARTIRSSKRNVRGAIGLIRAEFHSWLTRYKDYVGFMELFDPVIKAFEQVEARLEKEFPRDDRKAG